MRKLIASVLGLGFALALNTPVMANTNYTDDAKISDWSSDYVNILQSLDVLVGYPDGSFRPNANLTREEYAVSLTKALIMLEESLLDAQYETDWYLYQEIVSLQTQLLEVLYQVDALAAKAAVENNNFVAISAVYTPDRDDDTSEVSIELSAKIQIIELSDTFAISVRPWVNSNTEVGGALTVDADITSDLEVYAGAGAAYRADEDSSGALTGFDDNVVPYATAGISYNLSEEFVVTLDGKVPFNSGEGKEPTVGLGFGFRF